VGNKVHFQIQQLGKALLTSLSGLWIRLYYPKRKMLILIDWNYSANLLLPYLNISSKRRMPSLSTNCYISNGHFLSCVLGQAGHRLEGMYNPGKFSDLAKEPLRLQMSR
jgi:hypothetical protein